MSAPIVLYACLDGQCVLGFGATPAAALQSGMANLVSTAASMLEHGDGDGAECIEDVFASILAEGRQVIVRLELAGVDRDEAARVLGRTLFESVIGGEERVRAALAAA